MKQAPVPEAYEHLPQWAFGDSKEMGAIREVFGDKMPHIQSTKSLTGHSLGGAIASVLGGALPERIEQLWLIEALGPMSTPPAQGAELLEAEDGDAVHGGVAGLINGGLEEGGLEIEPGVEALL